MNDDYASGVENPFYSELKYFCKKIQEAYSELKEDLTPFRDDRFYRWVRSDMELGLGQLLFCTVAIFAVDSWKNRVTSSKSSDGFRKTTAPLRVRFKYSMSINLLLEVWLIKGGHSNIVWVCGERDISLGPA